MPNTAYLSGLPLNIDVVQILLHMLNFVILAGVLGLLVYKPAAKFLSERRVILRPERILICGLTGKSNGQSGNRQKTKQN